MLRETTEAGFYEAPSQWGSRHPRLQILTIKDLLDVARIDYPMHHPNVTFKHAPKHHGKKPEQGRLLLSPRDVI
jgi:hypothetical protein